LAIIANLEYRMDFLIDAIMQPTITAGIELLLWLAIFKGVGQATIAGFDQSYYLAYALWAAFFARLSSSWMYEFRMSQEVESGSVNSLIVRPMSFYEYYLSQLMGYKLITGFFSFLVPAIVVIALQLPNDFSRLPLALLLTFYYLFFVHSLGFFVACTAFHLTKTHAITMAKNLTLWIFSGELFPLDLMPEPIRGWFVALPFCSGVYIPVGYLNGRLDISAVWSGFASVTVGLAVINTANYFFWQKSLRTYTGTGA
jgi:ABC-2 type transport system permease protein